MDEETQAAIAKNFAETMMCCHNVIEPDDISFLAARAYFKVHGAELLDDKIYDEYGRQIAILKSVHFDGRQLKVDYKKLDNIDFVLINASIDHFIENDKDDKKK